MTSHRSLGHLLLGDCEFRIGSFAIGSRKYQVRPCPLSTQYIPDVPGIGLEWNEDVVAAGRFDSKSGDFPFAS
jgi:hypothetical protein